MLPLFEDEVLFDTDYFTNLSDTSRYLHYFYKSNDLRPWISVEKVTEVFTNIGIGSRVVTIAVSPHHTRGEYHNLSWIVAYRISIYFSEINSLNEKMKSYSSA